jgi:methionyl-tRNA formyltransferase
VQKLDAGNMIAQRASSFLPNETAGEATKRLFGESVALLGEALGKLKDQTFQGEPQDESRVTHCRKLKKEDGAIDWSLSAREILNRWRGLTPWPGIYSKAQDKRVTILGMERVSESDLMPSKTPGATHYDKPRKRLLVACGEGCVGLIRLQWEGGKPLAAADFWNGVRVKENFQMESIRA